jgi:membrane protease YdiL (CAAX protease family)
MDDNEGSHDKVIRFWSLMSTGIAPAKPFPGFAQSLLVLLILIAVSLPAGIPMIVFKILKMNSLLPWASLFSQLASTGITLWICTHLGKKVWSDFFPIRPVAPTVWPLTVVATVGLILLINGLDGWVHRLLPAPAWFRAIFADMGGAAMVLGAPLAEEPVFRGLILGGFALRYGPRKAVVYSALLFAAFHLNPWQFHSALLAGLFLGWLCLESGSLWPGMLGHFLNNLAYYFAVRWKVAVLTGEELQPWWMWGAGVVLLLLGLAGLRWSFQTRAEELPA